MAYINTSLFTVQHPTNPNRESLKGVFGQNKITMFFMQQLPVPTRTFMSTPKLL